MNALLRHTITGVFEGYVTLPHGRKRVWWVPSNNAVWVETQEARLDRDGCGHVDVDGYRYRVRTERAATEYEGTRAVACWAVEFAP